MMYQEKLVLAVKANGKILREQKDSVYVPFGAEYSLLIKNKNSVRAVVRVEIDGVDVLDGDCLVIGPNQDLDLERYIKAGNNESGNRFKFIERTAKIENGPRGIKADDGLIRIEFEFEQQKPAFVPGPIFGSPIYNKYNLGDRYFDHYRAPMFVGQAQSITTTYSSGDAANIVNMSSQTMAPSASGALRSKSANDTMTEDFYFNQVAGGSLNEIGITVPGSESHQKFRTVTAPMTDGVKHCMVMRIVGQIGEELVKEPVTVKTKPICQTCSTVNKFGDKFCSECGTALTIL